MTMRCVACGIKVPGVVSASDWEGTLCDDCWSLTNRITRGWFALVQRAGDAAGWPERYELENNIIFDILAAQARQARNPPAPRKQRDPRRVLVDMSKVGKPRGGYARQLERERNRGRR